MSDATRGPAGGDRRHGDGRQAADTRIVAWHIATEAAQ